MKGPPRCWHKTDIRAGAAANRKDKHRSRIGSCVGGAAERHGLDTADAAQQQSESPVGIRRQAYVSPRCSNFVRGC